jgi:hypothetical protein
VVVHPIADGDCIIASKPSLLALRANADGGHISDHSTKQKGGRGEPERHVRLLHGVSDIR